MAAAVALADAEGMAALSMRAVGDRLGRTAMALYTYVPGKSELLDLMYDAVHAELPTAYRESAPDDWRAPLTAWAGDVLEFYVRHPWVLQVSQARPVLGPHEYAGLDTLITLLRVTGLEAGVVRRLVGTLFPFVRGSAQTVADARLAATATGSSDAEWWAARSAALTELVPDFAERFPAVSGLEAEGPVEPYPDQTPPLTRSRPRTPGCRTWSGRRARRSGWGSGCCSTASRRRAPGGPEENQDGRTHAAHHSHLPHRAGQGRGYGLGSPQPSRSRSILLPTPMHGTMSYVCWA